MKKTTLHEIQIIGSNRENNAKGRGKNGQLVQATIMLLDTPGMLLDLRTNKVFQVFREARWGMVGYVVLGEIPGCATWTYAYM